MSTSSRPGLRLLGAFATIPAALALSFVLEAAFGNVFLMFPLVGVLVAGLLAGAGVALATAAVQTLVHGVIFFAPEHFTGPGHEGAKLLTFAGVAVVIAIVAGRVRQTQERLVTERERSEQASQRLRRLSALATEFSAASTPAQVSEVAFRACRGIGATFANISWVSADGRELEALFAFGHPAISRRFDRYPVDAPLPNAEAFRRGVPVVLASRVACATVYPHLVAFAEEAGIHAWLSWPLVLRGRSLGALGLGFDRPTGFEVDSAEMLAAIADQAAQALERSFLLARAEESERRFRLLAENAPDLVYRMRLLPEPAFEYVSPSALAMTGYTPEEHYADPALGQKLVLPEDLPMLHAALEGKGPDPLLLRWRRKDGSVTWTEQRNVVFRDPHGRPVAIEGIARDVTQRIEVERERERLVSDREDLLRAVSHDFRTPIQAVLLRAETILRNPRDPEKAARNAHAIVDSARRMSAAVQDVVHVARLTAGGLAPRREAIALEPFVQEVAHRLFGEEDLARLEFALAPGLVVAADPDHLERILTNLVENALKYSDAPAPVRVASAAEGTARVLSVADRGPGIPAEDVPQLFQRYFRGSRPSGREGTGLGLFVTRMLAEAQGGSVSVDTAEGRGSTFQVRLPAP